MFFFRITCFTNFNQNLYKAWRSDEGLRVFPRGEITKKQNYIDEIKKKISPKTNWLISNKFSIHG